MKITKKDVSCVVDVDSEKKSDECVECSKAYADARDHILAAINCLGQNAKGNKKAKDSIANLSVVLLDLQ